MPVYAPFLAKFAKPPHEEEAKSRSGNARLEKGTIVTKVNHETTDDDNAASQPFLMRFAVTVLRGGRPKPPPETLYTEVARETTDDR